VYNNSSYEIVYSIYRGCPPTPPLGWADALGVNIRPMHPPSMGGEGLRSGGFAPLPVNQ
jgi:hypothetical protein